MKAEEQCKLLGAHEKTVSPDYDAEWVVGAQEIEDADTSWR